MRARRCAAAAGALFALGTWLVLPTAGPAAAAVPAQALTLRTSFAPAAVGFGDTVVGRIDVIVDRRTVRPETVHAVFAVAPLTLVAQPAEHRVTNGSTTVVSYELRAACLSDRCISAAGPARPALAPVRVDAQRRDGTRVRAGAAWPQLEIAGRVTPAEVAAARPPFRVDTSTPAVTYRIAPTTLARLLEILAVLLIVVGFALGAAVLVRRAKRSPGTRGDALQHALLLARRSTGRPGPDRRSALGLVARLLAPRDRPLARAVDDLAWSRPTPTPERLTDLLDEVEREIHTQP